MPDQDIDDIVHDAYVRLERYRAAADGEVREPEAFLVRAASNLATDIGRRRQRSPFVDADMAAIEVADDAPRADEIWLSAERNAAVAAAFAALDPLTQEMLRAQRLEGLRVDEIARYHGLSKSTVEKRLARGMLFLTKWVAES